MRDSKSSTGLQSPFYFFPSQQTQSYISEPIYTTCLEIIPNHVAFVTQGIELQLCTDDRVGLLSDITRIFRENSLCIKRAEISTKDRRVKHIFYVTDVGGNPVDPKIIDSIRRQVGPSALQVKYDKSPSPKPPQETTMGFLFSNIFRARTLQNFKLIRSYS